jgi:poly-gamma-glutamate synthesis protein (capsule biosynthesis protein)
MVSKGFNLVSTANNHILDKGTTGVERSHDFWKSKENVIMQGSNLSQEEYDEIPVVDVNGISFSFLAYCHDTNGIPPAYSYEINYYPGHVEEMLDKVRRADEISDVVIVSMHWGVEYSHGVSAEQSDLARSLVDAGADIIIGNHPHVVEPFEWIDGKPVFYAMGNLIGSQIGYERRIGITGALDITKTMENGQPVVTISNARAQLNFIDYVGGEVGLRSQLKVYPFEQLTDDILPGHEQMFEEYKNIITSLDDNIAVGSF